MREAEEKRRADIILKEEAEELGRQMAAEEFERKRQHSKLINISIILIGVSTDSLQRWQTYGASLCRKEDLSLSLMVSHVVIMESIFRSLRS